jgi:hypothetical protein
MLSQRARKEVSPKSLAYHRSLRNLHACCLPPFLLHLDQEKPETRPHIQEPSFPLGFKQIGCPMETGLMFPMIQSETLFRGVLIETKRDRGGSWLKR